MSLLSQGKSFKFTSSQMYPKVSIDASLKFSFVSSTTYASLSITSSHLFFGNSRFAIAAITYDPDFLVYSSKLPRAYNAPN